LISKGGIFYGWVIVAIALVIMTVTYTVYQSWSVFYVAILNTFGWGRAETALIFSAGALFYTFGSPISGFLFDKFGPRKLFTIGAILIGLGLVGCNRATEVWQFALFYAFLIACGTALTGFVPNLALVSAWFDRRRATAVGIAQMGTRDSFLLLPVIQLAISGFGYQNAYLLLLVPIIIINIPLAQFLRARPQDMGLMPDGVVRDDKGGKTDSSEMDDRIVDREWATTDWTLSRAIKKYQFWAFFMLLVGSGFTVIALINHFVAMLTDVGYTAVFAASVLAVYAVSSMIGRGLGFVSDIIGREVATTLCVAMMFFSLPILLIIKDTSAPWLLYVFVFFFGLSSGMLSPSFTSATADLFQGRKFGTIFGTANMGFGLGSSIGTFLYGYIYDVNGTYTLAIIITMIAIFIMGISIWVAAPRKIRRVGRKRQ